MEEGLMAKPRKRRFDIRKRADGKFIKWEQRLLSELGILPEVERGVPGYDHTVWVITGVFNSRGAAFAK
jgi:hypothetical protein